MADTPSLTGGAAIEAEPASELRTFLFADVRGYTRFTQEHGDAAAAALVTKFAALMRDGVEAHGGTVIELRGDEALAVFPSAREALRAAVELQDRFAQETEVDPLMPLPVGIGIDAGEAVRLEEGYRGEALNLAARLCNLAGPGEVLASEGAVYLGRRAQGVSYAERGLVPLKGFTDPVRVIRVIRESEALAGAGGASPANGYPAQGASSFLAERALPIGGFLGALPSGVLVGRDEEWRRVTAALEEVMQGRGQMVLLSGEPGIGKTRLAQEVTLKARHWGFLVATGRCYEPEQSIPFYPFLEPLVTLYNACPGSIRAEIPRRWPPLARLLPEEIVPAEDGRQQPADSILEKEDQQRLFRAVTGFLQAIAETVPVALLLDDLHWADDSSLKLLQHLARYTRGHRVLLLGTYRDVEIDRLHPLETALLDLGREQLVEEVEVRRFTPEGTTALVGEILGENEDLADLADLVYRRTDGNAFFIQEMVRALVERGDVYRKDGRWERRAVNEMEVPKSIRSLIGQRLSRLDERAQEILREASVLGQRFGFEELLALGVLIPLQPATLSIEGREQPHVGGNRPGWSEDEIESALEGAMAAGLIRETAGEEYAFNHALTQQALYAELTTRRRKRLHLAAGKALEWLAQRSSRQRRERRAAELAWHFLEGDDGESALPYSISAGDEAEEVFAHGEAERHYRTALELAEELEDRARIVEALEKLAEVLTIVARYDKALDMLERAAKLHVAAGNLEGEACAVAHMGQVHYLRGTPQEGIERLRPLVESREAARVTGFGLAALWAALARLYGDIDAYEDQLKAAERSIALAREVQDRPEAARLLLGAEVTRSTALWRLGGDDEALQELEGLISRAEAAGDLDNLSRALGNAAVLYGGRGEFGKDMLYQERALQAAERRGDRGQILLTSIQLSETAFVHGDWRQARAYLERAESLVRSLSASRVSVWPVIAHGWLELREGNLDGAVACAEETLSLAGSRDTEWRRLADRLLAEVDLLRGDPVSALDRLTPWLEQSGGKRDLGLLRSLALIHFALRSDQDLSLVEQAVKPATSQKHAPEIVETLVAQGKIAVRWGRLDEAERLFADALAQARTIPFAYGEARTLEEWAAVKWRQGEGEAAREQLSAALATYEQLGARLDAERTRRALAERVYQA